MPQDEGAPASAQHVHQHPLHTAHGSPRRVTAPRDPSERLACSSTCAAVSIACVGLHAEERALLGAGLGCRDNASCGSATMQGEPARVGAGVGGAYAAEVQAAVAARAMHWGASALYVGPNDAVEAAAPAGPAAGVLGRARHPGAVAEAGRAKVPATGNEAYTG